MDLIQISKKALADCTPEAAFWSNNSVVCRNIYELVNCIRGMNEYSFNYHVNEGLNKKNCYSEST